MLFRSALQRYVPTCELVPTMDDAVERARALAQPGDVVLLSPAATSFDEYPSFEFRGSRFRELVEGFPGFVPSLPESTPETPSTSAPAAKTEVR